MSTNLSYALLPEMAIFVQVVESGSFSAAARKLGTSPSAVSRSVAKLEQALAVQLLHRTTRQLRLTEAIADALQQRDGHRIAEGVVQLAVGNPLQQLFGGEIAGGLPGEIRVFILLELF